MSKILPTGLFIALFLLVGPAFRSVGVESIRLVWDLTIIQCLYLQFEILPAFYDDVTIDCLPRSNYSEEVENFLYGYQSMYDMLILDEEATITAAYLGKSVPLSSLPVLFFGDIGERYQLQLNKLLHKNISSSEMDNFLKEISLMKKLRPHANVILFYGVTTSPPAVVTEFAELGSLLTRLKDKDDKVDEKKTEILMGVALGMYHLHNESVIHRDLAARNILLTGTYQPKISNNLEDIWSFGILIVEILTRDIPYPGLEPLEIAANVAMKNIQPSLPATAPKPFKELLDKCCEFKVESRLADFMKVYELLKIIE